MKSIKEVSVESKILKRLHERPDCLKLVNYLFEDEELQENIISIMESRCNDEMVDFYIKQKNVLIFLN